MSKRVRGCKSVSENIDCRDISTSKNDNITSLSLFCVDFLCGRLDVEVAVDQQGLLGRVPPQLTHQHGRQLQHLGGHRVLMGRWRGGKGIGMGEKEGGGGGRRR